MRACLICAEFFGWGTRGGFGYATRIVGRELVKQGLEVHAVVPRPAGKSETELELDGVRIIGIERRDLLSAKHVFRDLAADLYHSQQPSLLSAFAQQAVPDTVHLATLRDPRSARDWWTEFNHPTISRPQVLNTWAFYENPMARQAIRRMHGLYVPADFLAEKAQRLYGLGQAPGLLPTPVGMPEAVTKDEMPTICFVGRWDRIKRPELFFDLAERTPEARFLAIGKAHNSAYEEELRRRYSQVPNLHLVGYIDQFSSDRLSEYLGRSWILVNTSAKEALPNTFVEACAHRCAIVAPVNPDGFASRFGRHVTDGDYGRAIRELLDGGEWRRRGMAGFDYVRERNALERAARLHVDAYGRHLRDRR